MEQATMRNTAQRLVSLRSEILAAYPFFGRLLMRLPFGFAECGTAYTDMKKIVFDPAFASRLNDQQLCFLVLHELMHCVLKHCSRSKGKIHLVYNIACDIVVNSVVLEAMQLPEIEIDGSKAMHVSPDGKEGRCYSAEEVYEKLLKSANEDFAKVWGGSSFDEHTIWENSEKDSLIEELWDSYMKQAAKGVGGSSGIPDSVERYLTGIRHTPKISWKQVLHDYIRHDQCDYVFSKPDYRYAGDFIMPSFQENVEGSKMEKVSFFIDTSGSVSAKAITEAFEEIKDAIEQIGNMSGFVSFFDSDVSEPIPFEDIADIEEMKPIGGGGTSFCRIFEHIMQYDEEEIPSVIIIMTDGYATFPEEKAVPDIPVIWMMIDSEIESPWGECLHIYTEDA